MDDDTTAKLVAGWAVNDAKFALFAVTYKKNLIEAVIRDPRDYPSNMDAEKVADKLMASMKQNPQSVNIDTRTFRRTCKEVGIPCTYKGIRKYIGLIG